MYKLLFTVLVLALAWWFGGNYYDHQPYRHTPGEVFRNILVWTVLFTLARPIWNAFWNGFCGEIVRQLRTGYRR